VTSEGNLDAARNKWINWRNPAFGESHYPPYRLALRGVADPLDERFMALASRVLGPLYLHVQDPRL
jgi:exodeoxyribonuclease V gamma subunit